MRLVPLSASASLLALALFAAPSARADVLVELGNGDRVTGTFLPASETESYVVSLPEGATLSAKTAGKRRKGAGPVPSVRLLDPDGSAIATPALVATPTGARLKGFVAPVSGRYTIELTSASEGDYTFVASWRNPTGGKSVVDFAAGDDIVVPVHAAPGSSAKLRIEALDDPDGAPRFVRLRARDLSFDVNLLRVPPVAGPAESTPKIVLTTAAADFDLTVRQTGGPGGLATLTTRLVAPKSRPRKVDLSSRVLGTAASGTFAQGQVLGSGGGTVAAGAFADDPLSGASVEVPPGALAGTTVVFVGSARDVDPRGDVEPFGPPVEFGPSGLRFAEGAPARITIPFDADAFGGDFDGLVVLVREGNRVSVVPADTVEIDASAGTVSFPASHFSTYQVFGPRRAGRSDVNADGFDDLALPAPYAGGFRGTVRVVFGGADLASGSSNDAGVSIFGNAGNEGAFGYLTALGDVDGDDATDLAVLSYGFESGYFGVARVFRGGPAFTPDEASDAEIEVRTGAADGGALGAVGIADVTGDGVADLVLGAPDASGAVAEEGHVFVLPGGSGLATTTTDAPGVIRLAGGVQDWNLGQSLAFADFSGDGILDVAVGAPRRLGGSGDLGAVVVFKGGPQLASGTIERFAVLTGTVPDARFGAALAAADFDGDGFVDLAVAAPRTPSQVPGVPDGAVYVFRGPMQGSGTADDAAETIVCAPATGAPLTTGGGEFGASLTAANVVGSTLRDLVIGCPTATPASDPTRLGAGAIVIVRGDSKFGAYRDLEFGDDAGGSYGGVVLPCIDADGDRSLETVIAAPDAAAGAGRVFVRFGPNRRGRTVTITGTTGEHLGGRSYVN
jgi:hypothetical protein